MAMPSSRREFLANVGRGALVATVGYELARGLGLSSALADEGGAALNFGELESLVCLMQETPAAKILPALAEQLRAGKDLKTLVSAAALANARTFGGEDYVGFHTMMALSPALHMSRELPAEQQPLPVFKVLYRNTNRIQEHGGRKDEVLHPVSPAVLAETNLTHGEVIREAVHRKDVKAAEETLAAVAKRSPEEAFNAILYSVQDNTEVHRTVLPYRAWDMIGLVGAEHATTMLRQSVRYCVRAEGWQHTPKIDEPRTLLPKLLDEHKLMGRNAGDKAADDAWVDNLSQTIFKSSAEQAAGAVAAALAEGFAPAAIGEAITLAANQLVLRDQGRRPQEEVVGKPTGSVHGDSIGVHALDSANAWRNMARVSNTRNTFACLILGAYQAALDRTGRGGDFQNWQPLPIAWHLNGVKGTEPVALLKEAEEAIRGNLQAHAAAVIAKYGQLGHPPQQAFELLLKYAISEDGALHAEKFYRTSADEFTNARPAFKWRYLIGLARVTASEFGRPAPGMAQARELLKV